MIATEQRTGKKAGGRSELTREAIVDTALAIADAEGLEAVTIRAVAASFGVTPMALYWHVANKDELLNAMGDRLFDGLAERVSSDGPWEGRLRTVMEELLDALRAHPGAVSLAFPRILACEDGRLATDHTLSILAESGLPADRCAYIACHALEWVVTTVTAESASLRPGAPQGHDAADAKHAMLSQLPLDRYPHLSPVIHLLVGNRDPCRPVSYSEVGLEIFLAGVVALSREPRSVPPAASTSGSATSGAATSGAATSGAATSGAATSAG